MQQLNTRRRPRLCVPPHLLISIFFSNPFLLRLTLRCKDLYEWFNEVQCSAMLWLWRKKEKQDYPSQTLWTTHYLRPKLSSMVMNIRHFWLQGCFAVSGLWDNSLSTSKTKIWDDEHQGLLYCTLINVPYS